MGAVIWRGGCRAWEQGKDRERMAKDVNDCWNMQPRKRAGGVCRVCREQRVRGRKKDVRDERVGKRSAEEDERTGDKRTEGEGEGVGWRSGSEKMCPPHSHLPLWPTRSIFKHWIDVTLVADATLCHLALSPAAPHFLHPAFVWFNYTVSLCNTVIGEMHTRSEVWHWSRRHLRRKIQRPFKLKFVLW